MNTFLLTWNSKETLWDEDGKKTIDESIEKIKNIGYYENTWSTGNLKKIEKNDRIFMFRLGEEPRGIIASGFVTKGWYQDEHWQEANRKANYIEIRYDIILNFEKNAILAETYLNKLEIFNSIIQVAQEIPYSKSEKLEAVWKEFNLQENLDPDDIGENDSFFEGAINTVTLNLYERDSKARQKCLEKYGYSCSICGFNFEKFYGILGKDFIHVHHKTPLSTIGKEYKINPIKDLIPVCPNCHAMLHKSKIVLDSEELINIIAENK